MTTVGQVLDQKGHQVWTVTPETTVLEALKIMQDKNIGAVLVMEGDEMVGIMSERDCARKMALEQKCAIDAPVSAIMTPNVLCIHYDQPLEECMAVMTNRRVRHLPVCNQGTLAGVISIGDVVKSLISDREFVISQLETYITGGPAAS